MPDSPLEEGPGLLRTTRIDTTLLSSLFSSRIPGSEVGLWRPYFEACRNAHMNGSHGTLACQLYDTRTHICVCKAASNSPSGVFQVGVMGPFEVAGVIGLCEGVLFRLMRSVTSTSSPTRRTAPDGPAQAYWPKTGLSRNRVRTFDSTTVLQALRLTWEFLVDSSVFREKAVKLAICGDHTAFCQIRVQAQAANGPE